MPKADTGFLHHCRLSHRHLYTDNTWRNLPETVLAWTTWTAWKGTFPAFLHFWDRHLAWWYFWLAYKQLDSSFSLLHGPSCWVLSGIILYCFGPACSSNSRKKVPGLSFPETSSGTKGSERWPTGSQTLLPASQRCMIGASSLETLKPQ